MQVKKWIRTHTYCLFLLYFVFYLLAFFLLEKFAVPKYIVHCWLDDRIPFCEWFVIPYFMWFLLLAVSLGYFMFKSKEDFQNLCFLMFSGMTFCLFIYAVLPNGLNLRCDIPRDNLLCEIVRFLYRIDTPSNVCPSIHVSSTVAVNEVVHRSSLLRSKKTLHIGSSILTVMICLATVFIKQHSVIDVVCGILLSQVLCVITYRFDWRSRLADTKLKLLL